MPAHTRLWRSQEGIATLSYPPEPTLRVGEAADTMAGEDDLNENPVSTEPFFDQLFMFIAIAVIGVCVLVLAIVVVRKLAVATKKKARRMTLAIKGDAATKSVDDSDYKSSPGQSTVTLVHAVVVAVPSPRHDADEKFRPLCSEKTLTTLSQGVGYKVENITSAGRSTH